MVAMTKEELVKAIKSLGLGRGDALILHSSLSSIGRVEGGAETVVEAFLDVIGPEGTLMAPTFVAPGEVFDPENAPTGLGSIAEAVRKHPKAVRSRHPLASVAAIGAAARELVKDHEKAETAHGEGTPYMRLAEMGGYVVLLGVDQDRSTTLHTPEALARLPYLKVRSKAYLDENGRKREGKYAFFPGPHRDFIGLDRVLREKGIVKLGRIGKAVVRIMKAKPMIDEVLAMLRRDPAAVLCDNPECDDCVKQRADIRRAVLAEECFSLSAASHVAGSTADEIVRNLLRAGIDNLEVSIIGRKDVAQLSDEELRDFGGLLSSEGISVSAVRSRSWLDEIGKVVTVCEELGAERVVLPLLPGIENEVRAAREAGLTVLLENGAIRGVRAKELLKEYADEGVLLSFNPAGFVLAGEKPFLTSYRAKLYHRMGQLVVCDMTWSGRQTPLARGNGEINELISILRCRSFDGTMLLASPGRECPFPFRETADAFFDLLGSL